MSTTTEAPKSIKVPSARNAAACRAWMNEHFPMSRINDAFARLESGEAHYRIVLDKDF